MAWKDDGDADAGTPSEPGHDAPGESTDREAAGRGPSYEPFPDEGPMLQASALGWKKVVGIGVLAAVGFLAADQLGWLGGDSSGVPFEGVPVDSSGRPEPGPAVRGRGADAAATSPGATEPAAGPSGDTRAATAGGAAPAQAGAAGIADEPQAAADTPKAAVPDTRPSRPAEDGPLPLSEFVLIRPGSFQMGYPDAGADQQPVHAVILSTEFYLQKSEVTQGQWRSVMGSNPSHFSGCDDCPVEQVSWHDVQAFLEALNARHPGRGYRLPTEAEWEYAARAGLRSGYEDVGALDEAAWYDANSAARTHPVESKLANPWGLYDMHGSVAEWVSDWYRADYYRTGPAVDPPGPRDGAARVVRGGGWGSARRFVGTLGRMDRDPFTRDWSIGFRLARDP
ncbi:MAG TPA: formylglycine-generating enzyme family protein [Longimicrobiales bacterium]|nr:formylglycine-generating enzyme family protein [Longimicrobiales bacterium]